MEDDLEFAENLIEKLRVNGALTGDERKYIMDLIKSTDSEEETESDSESEPEPEPVELRNKKVQVAIKNVKDSCTQTDSVKNSSKAMGSSKKSRSQQLMDESYMDRRIFIFIQRPCIEDIKEKYPTLFSTSEMQKELDRIFYPGKSEEFFDHVTKYASAILECGKNKNLCQVIKGCMEEADSEDDKKYALQVGAILMLPVVVCQNADRKSVTYLRFEMQNPAKECDPYIYVNVNDLTELCSRKHLCKIIVEGVEVGKTNNFVEAVLVYFSCFFIFDIVYPDKDLNTHVAMERLFLNANETEEIGDYASEMIKRLKEIR